MKKHLIIGDPIEHSLSPKFIIIGSKKMIFKQYTKRKKLVLKKLKYNSKCKRWKNIWNERNCAI